jgi:aldose 1-epimerase
MGAAGPNTVELHAGALRLAVRPDLGGAVAGLWHRDTPILRSTEPGALADARSAACFPLVPYAERLGYRRFRWKGHDHTTRAHDESSPHSLHGVGWQRPWQVVSHGPTDLVLALSHAGDADWPFAFEARQHFALTPQSLVAQLSITNVADQAQPVGLGWHPSFPRRARSRLHVDCSHRWDTDAAQLPVRQVAQPGIDADVAHLDFDNAFERWTGPARIRDEKCSLQLSSSLPWLVVRTPQDQDFFSVAPASHLANAIHMADPMAHGLRTLAPGETFEASMALEVTML